MDHSNFIGVGKNPDGPDLPLGLGMELAQNPKAMNAFGAMTKEEKADIISHIQGAATGDEAKSRIREVIRKLNHSV
jgi:uncharacterized protein YdeI (YjbR/CyaY-like superfamily)